LDVCPSAYSLLKFFNRLLITLQLLRCWSYSRSLSTGFGRQKTDAFSIFPC